VHRTHEKVKVADQDF